MNVAPSAFNIFRCSWLILRKAAKLSSRRQRGTRRRRAGSPWASEVPGAARAAADRAAPAIAFVGEPAPSCAAGAPLARSGRARHRSPPAKRDRDRLPGGFHRRRGEYLRPRRRRDNCAGGGHGNELLRYERLAEDLRGIIVAGNLRPGERLPSVRRLARERHLSVSTVLQALHQLEDRGLVEARPQSGYFVRHAQPARATDRPLDPGGAGTGRCQPAPDARSADRRPAGVAPLAAALPSSSLMPLAPCSGSTAASRGAIRDLLEGGSHINMDEAGTDPPAGPALGRLGRTAGGERVRHHQLLHRGPGTLPAGGDQPGDTVAVESPGYYLMLQLLETLGLRALEIPTDPRTGLSIEALDLATRESRVAACLLVANASNPLGSIMPDEHKRRLAKLTAERGVAVIEDDIYGDLYFGSARRGRSRPSTRPATSCSVRPFPRACRRPCASASSPPAATDRRLPCRRRSPAAAPIRSPRWSSPSTSNRAPAIATCAACGAVTRARSMPCTRRSPGTSPRDAHHRAAGRLRPVGRTARRSRHHRHPRPRHRRRRQLCARRTVLGQRHVSKLPAAQLRQPAHPRDRGRRPPPRPSLMSCLTVAWRPPSPSRRRSASPGTRRSLPVLPPALRAPGTRRRPFVRQHVADEADPDDGADVGLRQAPSDQEIAAAIVLRAWPNASASGHAGGCSSPATAFRPGRLRSYSMATAFSVATMARAISLLHLPPFAAATRGQRRDAALGGQFVEVVELIGALVERLAVRQRQHRHLEQRIERAHGVHVPKHRQRRRARRVFRKASW
jgi:hypothetical protein